MKSIVHRQHYAIIKSSQLSLIKVNYKQVIFFSLSIFYCFSALEQHLHRSWCICYQVHYTQFQFNEFQIENEKWTENKKPWKGIECDKYKNNDYVTWKGKSCFTKVLEKKSRRNQQREKKLLKKIKMFNIDCIVWEKKCVWMEK